MKSRRYVKVEFFGYAPIDLAIQMHLLGKKTDVNTVGENMKPYTEYDGEYSHLTTQAQTSSESLNKDLTENQK